MGFRRTRRIIIVQDKFQIFAERGILSMYIPFFVVNERRNYMKLQWNLLLGLLFAIIIAVFAVFNVDVVPVNYVFGESEWPLVLVILCAALLGAAVSGFIAMFLSFQTGRRIKDLQKEMTNKELTIATQQNEIAELQKYTALPSNEEMLNGNNKV